MAGVPRIGFRLVSFGQVQNRVNGLALCVGMCQAQAVNRFLLMKIKSSASFALKRKEQSFGSIVITAFSGTQTKTFSGKYQKTRIRSRLKLRCYIF
ncbi:hypothetical protein CUMW_234870 [Citrus unshiu]|uniref:Uncharacterized protein n=1 Tax=Citrus unshiu TaxID=55188 RepID=A0A2H5QJ17_CITUN|nr:hypothetical protein CUMW_234870 [Citrus unshiu]